MNTAAIPPLESSRPSCVYGPVQSWRLGTSLGVDPILSHPACSFRCIYCQLGSQEPTTTDRERFVNLDWLVEDLKVFKPFEVDNLTFAGSGEPTLADNLGVLIREAKKVTGLPVVILTNGSLLHQAEVRRDLQGADLVCCKLDAGNPASFARINRPHSDVSFLDIFRGIHALCQDMPGKVRLQVMVSPMNIQELDQLGKWIPLLGGIDVDLTTPSRRVPEKWNLEHREGTGMGGLITPVDKQALLELKKKLEAAGSNQVRIPPQYRDENAEPA